VLNLAACPMSGVYSQADGWISSSSHRGCPAQLTADNGVCGSTYSNAIDVIFFLSKALLQQGDVLDVLCFN
jgi:hypothetical protein